MILNIFWIVAFVLWCLNVAGKLELKWCVLAILIGLLFGGFFGGTTLVVR
jgi:hypothetical protein